MCTLMSLLLIYDAVSTGVVRIMQGFAYLLVSDWVCCRVCDLGFWYRILCFACWC